MISQRVLLPIAPLVLLTVASYQMFQAATRLQTPWKGGGFGMFAAIATRYIIIDCVDLRDMPCRIDLSDSLVPPPRAVQSLAQRIVARPTKGEMAHLARILLSSRIISSNRVSSLVSERLKEVPGSTTLGLQNPARDSVTHYRLARSGDSEDQRANGLKSIAIRVIGVRYNNRSDEISTDVLAVVEMVRDSAAD